MMDDPLRQKALQDFLKNFGMEKADIALVNLALTHSSYSFEQGALEDNERLEFLGDALLGFLVSRYLYEKFPEADEGTLSKRKSSLVSRSMLGRQAKALGLGPLVLLGKGEEISGGRRRSNLLGCSLEALIGAFYLSLPLEQVTLFVREKIIRSSELLLHTDIFTDFKSQLQEYVQKKFRCVPEYKLISEKGPDHNKRFRVEVFIMEKSYGMGYGTRKKNAENEAARAALERLQNEGISNNAPEKQQN
jgi:ribonuclease-3